MKHKLKTDPAVFAAVLCGAKTHEIRFNDRNFQIGDELLLQETSVAGEMIKRGYPLDYTGREIATTVTHILEGYGLMPGWVILSIAAPAQAARNAALANAAELVEDHQETDSNVAGKHLTPRRKDNLIGLAYAAGIRAMITA